MAGPDELPQPVQAAIDRFTAAARECFADDLISVVLFGSAADGRLRPTSDVNVMIVLARLDPRRLDAVGAAYRAGHAAIRLSAMFVLASEIATASDAFAVKFFDIAARHRILFGSDPFTGMTVAPEAARRRLRQVLVNLVLRLRERLALAGPYEEQLALAAAESVGPLRSCATLLRSLEAGGAVAPRLALAEFAAEAGQAPSLAAITEARESGTVPSGGAVAAVLGAMTLAEALMLRAEGLGPAP